MPRGTRAFAVAAIPCCMTVLLAVVVGCRGGQRSAPPPAQDSPASEAPLAALLELESARIGRDLAGFVDRLDSAVLVLPPDEELLAGPELVGAWLADGFPRMCSLRPSRTVASEVSSRWAYFTWWVGDSGAMPTRVLAVLYRSEAGRWVLARLVWNRGPGPRRGGGG